VRVLYLDQNKWIALARAVKRPSDRPDLNALLKAIDGEVSANRMVVPLTATNIYETHKINDPQRRHDLASIQAWLSRGVVFRGRHKRLEAEISRFGQQPSDWLYGDMLKPATSTDAVPISSYCLCIA
jgi:hypothetical protein